MSMHQELVGRSLSGLALAETACAMLTARPSGPPEAMSAGPTANLLVDAVRTPGGLSELLKHAGSARLVDEKALLRALDSQLGRITGGGVSRRALASKTTKPLHVAVVVKGGEPPQAEPVVCVDVKQFGSLLAALEWAERYGSSVRMGGRLLIAALGPEGADLSLLGNYFDGAIIRPRVPSQRGWVEALLPLWIAHSNPKEVDILGPDEGQGGVSQEEFKETLKQAMLPNSDPFKRA